MRRSFNPLVSPALPCVTLYLVSRGVKVIAGFLQTINFLTASPISAGHLALAFPDLLSTWPREQSSPRWGSSGWPQVSWPSFSPLCCAQKTPRQLDPRIELDHVGGYLGRFRQSVKVLGVRLQASSGFRNLASLVHILPYVRDHCLCCALWLQVPFTKHSACTCSRWQAPLGFVFNHHPPSHHHL